MSFYEKFTNLCAQNGASPTAVADSIGLNRSAATGWKKGRKPSPRTLKDLAEYFDVPVEYFSDDYIQTAGTIGAGYNVSAFEDFDDEFFKIPEKLLKGHSKEDFICLKISGDSMLPDFKDGDFVLIQRSPTVENGKIAACVCGDETGTLKKIYIKGSTAILQPLNPEYDPLVLTGSDLDSLRILGEPKLLFRQI